MFPNDPTPSHQSSRGHPYDQRSHTHLSPSGMNYPAQPGLPAKPPGSGQHDKSKSGKRQRRENDPRAQLGHQYSGSLTPGAGGFAFGRDGSPYPYRSASHNPSPSITRPPPFARSWTMDAPPHLTVSPVHMSPSTGSPHHILPLSTSPLLDRPPLATSYSTGPGLRPMRSVSPSLSASSAPGQLSRRASGDVSARPERGNKARRGGPPKAILGGPGGKTFEQMQAARASEQPKVESESETGNGEASQVESRREGDAQEIGEDAAIEARAVNNEQDAAGKSEEKWKGKDVAVNIPPLKSLKTSQPSPVTPSDEKETSMDVKGAKENSDVTDSAPDPSVHAPAEASEQGKWKGKEVLVGLPKRVSRPWCGSIPLLTVVPGLVGLSQSSL